MQRFVGPGLMVLGLCVFAVWYGPRAFGPVVPQDDRLHLGFVVACDGVCLVNLGEKEINKGMVRILSHDSVWMQDLEGFKPGVMRALFYRAFTNQAGGSCRQGPIDRGDRGGGGGV